MHQVQVFFGRIKDVENKCNTFLADTRPVEVVSFSVQGDVTDKGWYIGTLLYRTEG